MNRALFLLGAAVASSCYAQSLGPFAALGHSNPFLAAALSGSTCCSDAYGTDTDSPEQSRDSASRPPGLRSVYINAQDAAERLQLNGSDGSFSLAEGGQKFSGTYSVSSNVLTLHIAQLGKDVDIAIDGNRLVVNGAEIWNAAPNSQLVPVRPAPSEPAQQQPQPDQAADGVWLAFYGTCNKGDLVIFKPTIYANKVELARLACNTYFYVAARPGTYKFCATKNKCATAAIGANGPYYFRILPTTLSYSIGQVDSSTAQDEIRDTGMTALDLGRVLAPKMVTTNTDNPPSVFLSPQ